MAFEAYDIMLPMSNSSRGISSGYKFSCCCHARYGICIYRAGLLFLLAFGKSSDLKSACDTIYKLGQTINVRVVLLFSLKNSCLFCDIVKARFEVYPFF